MEEPHVQVWFGDTNERELGADEMFLAVYAAGGGKRNMANFVRTGDHFRSSDVHLMLSPDRQEALKRTSRLFVCRYASARGEWVPKPISSWESGQQQLKLIPEWFKARFWDNKQEKKHPWFMFGFLCEAHDGTPRFFTSSAFPVHQYYPTGQKKTDPNEPDCRAAFHRVLKQAPSSTLRPETLLRRTGGGARQEIGEYGAHHQAQEIAPRRAAQQQQKLAAAQRPGKGGWQRAQHEPLDMEMDDSDDSDDSDDMKPYGHGQYHPQHFQHHQHWNPDGHASEMSYTEPMKNIGQRGLDAVEALLALRGFAAGPMR